MNTVILVLSVIITILTVFVYCLLFLMAGYIAKYNFNEAEIFAKLWTAGVYGGERTRYCPFRGVTRSPPHHAGPSFRLSLS